MNLLRLFFSYNIQSHTHNNKDFVHLSQEGDGRGVLLNALVTMRERNSSQASELETNSKQKPFIYLTDLKK